MKHCSRAALLSPGEKEDVQKREEDQDKDVCEWTTTLQLHTDVVPPPAQATAVDHWQQPVTGAGPPVAFLTTDGSTCPTAPQVTVCLISEQMHFLSLQS